MSTLANNYLMRECIMLTVEQLREKMMDRRLEVVSTRTGLHYNTLLAIRDGRQTSIKHDTFVRLSNYFNDNK